MDGLKWVLAAIVVILGVIASRSRKGTPAPPTSLGEAMPRPFQGLLIVYLLGLAVVLLYIVFKVFALDFPETPVVLDTPAEVKPAPAPGQAGGTETAPPALKLLRAIPNSTLGAAPTLQVTLLGTGFREGTKARINHKDRTSLRLADNLIQVSAQPVDVAGVGSFTAEVVNPDGAVSNALTIAVIRPRMNLHLFDASLPITRELQLLILVLCAGALGSYVHALKSFVDFLGNQSLARSWLMWYISRPFLGAVLAFIFYAVLRGGFLTGTPADVRVVNPFGAIAVAALVGMFSDKAAQKLAEIFDALFKGDDLRRDKLQQSVVPAIEGTLPAAKVGDAYKHELKATSGTAPYTWSAIGAPAWLTLDSMTGKLGGTPPAADVGTQKVTITVTDAKSISTSKAFDLTVNA